MKNKFELFIRSIIKNQGYLSLDQFLKMNVNFYYNNKIAIGSEADFITAPEISQLFGEMIAVYILQSLEKNNVKCSFNIVELGPGNAVMMSDIMRVINKFPTMKEKLRSIYLVESSDYLIDKQKTKLEKFSGFKIKWYKDVEEYVPDCFTIFIANEFFDALPIKQYCWIKGALHENVVTVDASNKLILTYIKSYDKFFLENHGEDFFEYSASRNAICRSLGEKIKKNGGQILIIDYGYTDKLKGSSLQAIKNHQKVGVFKDLGESDITSLVDFKALNSTLSFLNIKANIITQRDFLIHLGIEHRVKKLVMFGACQDLFNQQLQILIGKKEMGDLFKVLQAMQL